MRPCVMRSPALFGPTTPVRTPTPVQKPTSTSYAEPFLAVADARQVALVTSYRDIFPDKFAEIVKVQLSFLVDVPTDMLREESFVETSPAPHPDDSKKAKIRAQVLGSRLGKWLHKARKRGDDDSEGPVEVPCVREDQLPNFAAVVNFLLGQDTSEGLFRRCGSPGRQRELELLLVSGRPVHGALASSRFSAHDAAAALKAALSRLSEPILTRRFASLFAGAARLTRIRSDDRGRPVAFVPGDLELLRAKQLKALRLLFLLLPDTNRRLLSALLTLLAKVASSPRSRMPAAALGVLFAPCLLGVTLSGPQLSEQHRLVASGLALLIESAPRIAQLPLTVANDVAVNLSRISTDPVSTCVRYAANTPGHEPASGASAETRMAVARLYAEVARWPPSDRQRKMIRRLNNLNGGLIPQRSRCVDYLQRKTVERQSVRRRLFGPAEPAQTFPCNLLGTPVRENDGPSLISFGQSEPLSPEELGIRWTPPLCKVARCSPGRALNRSQTEHAPMVT